jgi:putative transcriptional regulator
MKTRKPLSPKELTKLEESRDPWTEAIEGLKDYKRGRIGRTTRVKVSPVVEARVKSGLSQAKFAELLGVSVRTLQDWEQGRREPSGAAKSLIRIAEERPDVLKQVFA